MHCSILCALFWSEWNILCKIKYYLFLLLLLFTSILFMTYKKRRKISLLFSQFSVILIVILMCNQGLKLVDAHVQYSCMLLLCLLQGDNDEWYYSGSNWRDIYCDGDSSFVGPCPGSVPHLLFLCDLHLIRSSRKAPICK